MNLKDRANKLKNDIPAIYFALREKDTPVIAKVIAGVTVAYALSPIDLIPDFIPVLGYLDDVIILPVLIVWTLRLIPEEVMIHCREKSADMWKAGKNKWYYAVPVVLVWLFVIFIAAKLLFF